jgi:hypothetical protein
MAEPDDAGAAAAAAGAQADDDMSALPGTDCGWSTSLGSRRLPRKKKGPRRKRRTQAQRVDEGELNDQEGEDLPADEHVLTEDLLLTLEGEVAQARQYDAEVKEQARDIMTDDDSAGPSHVAAAATESATASSGHRSAIAGWHEVNVFADCLVNATSGESLSSDEAQKLLQLFEAMHPFDKQAVQLSPNHRLNGQQPKAPKHNTRGFLNTRDQAKQASLWANGSDSLRPFSPDVTRIQESVTTHLLAKFPRSKVIKDTDPRDPTKLRIVSKTDRWELVLHEYERVRRRLSSCLELQQQVTLFRTNTGFIAAFWSSRRKELDRISILTSQNVKEPAWFSNLTQGQEALPMPMVGMPYYQEPHDSELHQFPEYSAANRLHSAIPKVPVLPRSTAASEAKAKQREDYTSKRMKAKEEAELAYDKQHGKGAFNMLKKSQRNRLITKEYEPMMSTSSCASASSTTATDNMPTVISSSFSPSHIGMYNKYNVAF